MDLKNEKLLHLIYLGMYIFLKIFLVCKYYKFLPSWVAGSAWVQDPYRPTQYTRMCEWGSQDNYLTTLRTCKTYRTYRKSEIKMFNKRVLWKKILFCWYI